MEIVSNKVIKYTCIAGPSKGFQGIDLQYLSS